MKNLSVCAYFNNFNNNLSTKVYICHSSWYQIPSCAHWRLHQLLRLFLKPCLFVLNLLTHYACSANISRSALFRVQLYWTFWTDPFSENVMLNSENKLITTTTWHTWHTWHTRHNKRWARGVDYRSIGHSIQKLWPKIDFQNFALCKSLV